MLMRFIIYGMVGWMMEVIWTGLHSLLHKDYSLVAKTYLWMFPIYGLVVCMEPIFIKVQQFPWIFRGGIYMSCIFLVEYLTGFLLKKGIGQCPWDYKGTPFQIKGLIRLDYAPVWFCVGLLMEWLFFRLLFFFNGEIGILF